MANQNQNDQNKRQAPGQNPDQQGQQGQQKSGQQGQQQHDQNRTGKPQNPGGNNPQR